MTSPRCPVPGVPGPGQTRDHLAARSDGWCEFGFHHRPPLQGQALVPGTEASHRHHRSRGGLWVASNLLWLCHRCHAWLHRERALADAGGWIPRGTVPAGQRPVWLVNMPRDRAGWWLLDDEDGMTPVGPSTHALPVTPVLPEWITP